MITYTFSGQHAQAATLPPVPAGLKSTFTLGLSSSPGNISWMTGSGARWDTRYQYLGGGANTGSSWSTWNTPAGAFAAYYMQNSSSAGYVPVFTYYQLLQSSPASGGTEPDKDFNNLNNPSTMNAYFSDFKLLMTQAGAFGKTVIVQIEPDLWGFLQMRSANPNNITAAVASSGLADVASYPNTVSGFAKALVGLRNQYAPNALLGFHISPWASTYGDISTSHDAAFNVAGAAQQTANFYLQTGANFDLMFYDVADRDAAFYQSQGDPNHWWDVNNTTYPNFNRFHQFVAAITSATGKRGMLWQVPLGNTLYRSENNTKNHYQDNRVQYYLNGSGTQHIMDLANAGITGILFGAGEGQQTGYDDAAADGISNPAAINGNNLTATLSDDDGGYLRLQGQAYYNRGAVSLPGGSPSATPTPVTPTATATSVPATATTAPATATATRVPATATATNVPATATATTAPATATTTPAGGSGGQYKVAYTIDNQWAGGYNASVIITNTGSSPVNGWTISWPLASGSLANSWNSTCVVASNRVSCKDAGYNASIGAGGSASFGMQYSGSPFTPTSFVVNNVNVSSGSGAAATPTPTNVPATATATSAPATATSVPATATPTRTSAPATATPTRTAVPTATATPVSGGVVPATWQMTGNVTGTLTSGNTVTINSNFTAPVGANGQYILDVELYDLATGVQLKQWFTTQTFVAGQTIPFVNTWSATPGPYQVRMGLFNTSWALLSWQGDGPIFQIN